MIDPDHKTIYKIYVTTTNIPNSGTKSNVFLQIYGKNKSEAMNYRFRSIFSEAAGLER